MGRSLWGNSEAEGVRSEARPRWRAVVGVGESRKKKVESWNLEEYSAPGVVGVDASVDPRRAGNGSLGD